MIQNLNVVRNTRILTETFHFGSSQTDLQDLQSTVSIYTSNMDPLVSVGCGMYQKRWAAYEQASSQESKDDEAGTKAVLVEDKAAAEESQAAAEESHTQLDEGQGSS